MIVAIEDGPLKKWTGQNRISDMYDSCYRGWTPKKVDGTNRIMDNCKYYYIGYVIPIFLCQDSKRKKTAPFLYPPLAYINQPLMGQSQKYISEIGIQSNTNEVVCLVYLWKYFYGQVKDVCFGLK